MLLYLVLLFPTLRLWKWVVLPFRLEKRSGRPEQWSKLGRQMIYFRINRPFWDIWSNLRKLDSNLDSMLALTSIGMTDFSPNLYARKNLKRVRKFFCEIDTLMFKQFKIPLYRVLRTLSKNPNTTSQIIPIIHKLGRYNKDANVRFYWMCSQSFNSSSVNFTDPENFRFLSKSVWYSFDTVCRRRPPRVHLKHPDPLPPLIRHANCPSPTNGCAHLLQWFLSFHILVSFFHQHGYPKNCRN